MAQSIFNLYSSSVFADHPLALWNLDDDYSFVGLTAPWPSSQSGQSLYQEDQLTATNGQRYDITNKNSIVWITRDGSFNESVNQNIFSIAYGNGTWVAVGTNEGFPGSRRSTDAVTWTTINMHHGSSIFSVAYGNNLWLAGGTTYAAQQAFRSSTDSVNWTTVLTTSDDSTYSIAYGNGIWMYGSINGIYVKTSTDIISWTTRYPKLYTSVQKVSYENNVWIAGGNYGEISTSTDSISWITGWVSPNWVTQTSNFVNSSIMSVTYGNGLWLAGGTNNQIARSIDAKTWVTQVINIGTLSIAYGNNLWVAVGYSGQIQTSIDTLSWTARTSNFGTLNISTVAYGNGIWVAGSVGLRTSTDAITWTTQTSNFGNTSINIVTYGNGLWLAGGGAGQLRISTDAITWTTQTSTMSLGNTSINAITYANSLWVMGSLNGEVRASTNAVTWVTRNTGYVGSAIIRSIAYGNGLWTIVGSNGLTTTSTDTITWVSNNSNFGTTQIRSVAFGNDTFVSVGDNEQIRTRSIPLRSSNFIETLNNRLTSITYGNNIWLLTSNTGEIQTSINAISWVTRQILNNSSILAGQAAYGNGKWVVNTYDGSIYTTFSSTDSITWNTTSGISQYLGTIAYGNNFWVASPGKSFYQSFSGEDLTIKTKPAETVGTSDSDFYFSTFAIAKPNGTIYAIPYDPLLNIDTSKDSLNINVFTYDYSGTTQSYELGLEHYVTWVTINPNSSVSGVYDIAYGNGVWVAGGGSFANTTPLYSIIALRPLTEMTVSTNGISWTTRSYAGTPRYSFTDNNAGIVFSNIAYGNGLWAAQGRYFFDSGTPTQSNRLYSSTDTINWVSRSVPLNGVASINSLEYGDNTWVAGGHSGNLISSTDLVSWTTRTSNFGNFDIRAINYSNNIWVMVGDYAQIRTSTNAINWVTRSSNINNIPTNRFIKVSYGNGTWIAAGTYETSQSLMLAYSTNAISWVAGNFYPPSSGDVGLSYGSGQWVVGSANGGLYVSTNGVSWVTRTSNFGNNTIKTIQYGNGLWIAGGNSGQIRYSTDTVSWVTANSHFGRTHYSESIYEYKNITNILNDEWQQHTYTTESNSWSIDNQNIVDIVSIPYLKVVPSENVNATIVSLYNFTVGQWSEQYNVESSGARTIPMIDTNVIQSVSAAYSSSTSIFKTVEIDAYSLSDQDNGYYIVENNKPIAINSKLPMVYGSGNITEIYPSSYGTPSIILPGKGFLHGSGKYRELTLEFWMKVNVSTKTPTKIVGPVSSDDGLYVHDGFITLNIGPNQKSYFISHWYRPCLIDITYNQRFATLIINGQTVIEMEIDVNQMNFPEITSFNNDWIGFYATESTQPFEIDCVAIYPYIVPEQLAKRRFVFGQGVGKSEDIVSRFGGSLTNIDFAFSNYTNNIKYPDITQWSGGFYSNVNADSKFLSLPQYNLPEINYSGSNTSIFSNGSSVLKDNIDLQNINYPVKHISLKPTSTYSNVYGSINFSSINILNEPARSIYGVFSINSSELSSADADPNISELTIMYFKNHSTGDVFKIYIDLVTNKLVYKFNTTLIEEFTLSITSNDLFFVAGIDIDTISTQYAAIVKKFFYNPKNITLSIGGYETNMFTGKIYKLTVNNDFFTRMDMDNWFNSNGLASLSNSASTTFNSDITKYIGNYSLLFKKASSSMIMDIGSRGYWEDSIPLTFFASYVKDINGNNSVYKLDLMQFNIDYPSNIYSNNSINTDNDFIKSFITLKTYEDVGNVLYSNYTITKDLGSERVVDFENIQTNIDITKFNVIDGTVIFAPKNIINFEDAYVTVHIELTSNGTSTEPLVLKEMSIASLAYDQVGLHPINTFNGNKMYPFSREGVIYTNQLKNPIAIDKYSMPYLFLTGDSGIQALPYSEVDNPSNLDYSRGLTIPINPNSLSEYSLYGFNLWICYKKDSLFEETLKFLTIKSNNLLLNFYLNYSDNGKRATVSVKSKNVSTYQNYENVSFYQDGIELDTPYLRPMSWTMLTFRFPTPITFNDYIGQLEINPGVLVNNVSLYSQDIDKKVDDIFETHLGLSNIVVQDQSTLVINSDSLSLYTDILWTNYIGKPV